MTYVSIFNNPKMVLVLACSRKGCYQPTGQDLLCMAHSPATLLTRVDSKQKDKTCTAEYCEQMTFSKGLCRRHYTDYYNHTRTLTKSRTDKVPNGDKRPVGRPKGSLSKYPRVTRICFIENCQNKHLAKGYCRAHYDRSIKDLHIPIDAPFRQYGLNINCKIEGCERKAKCKLMCQAHYVRAKKGLANALEPIHMGPRFCSIEGCGKPHQSKGLCSAHYWRIKERGVSRSRVSKK